MPKIFFCYRREDSAHQAGRIFDHLAAHFGKHDLFKDVDSMPLGLDFRRVLSQRVGDCDVLLAIIGDSWLPARDSAGARRLDNPGDFVRIEIESALARNIPVIPVLVGHAPVPQPTDLPDSLRELCFRHGLAVRADPDFHHDIERLIRGIHDILGAGTATGPAGTVPAGGKAAGATPPGEDMLKSGRVARLGSHARSYLAENVLKPAPDSGSSPALDPGNAAAERPPGDTGAVVAGRRGRTRQMLWATGLLIPLAAVVFIVIKVVREWGPTAENPLVESIRADVRREVESIRRRPTQLLTANDSVQWDDVLPPVDYSAFEIMTDERVVDLRQWKLVPPEHASELVCAASMIRRLRLRKLRSTNEVRFEFRTTGVGVFVSCPANSRAFRVAGQRSDGFVGGKRTKVRQMIVDVKDVPVGSEFSVTTLATYWNSLQADDDLWFGAIGYENSYKVSLLIVFPESKPFTEYRLMDAPTKNDKPRPFDARKILLTSEDRDWLYWEIPDPKPAHVYSLYWSW